MKCVLTTIILLALGICTQAQPGTLNPSFGDSGKVFTYYANSTMQCYASALQSDNKIIAAGSLISNGFDDFMVLRYLPNGILDDSFGEKGRMIVDFGYSSQRAFGVAIQPDGKIVVTGYGLTGFFDPIKDIVTARLNTDGSLDSSFGAGGKVITDINGYEEIGTTVAVQSDGKILVGGVYKGNSFVLLRYNTDGTIDDSFADNGKVILTLSGAFSLGSLAVQPDGKILAGGATTSKNGQCAVIRFNENGSLDPGFGAAGFVYSKFTDYGDQFLKLLLQEDSKIIGVGRTGLFAGDNKDKSIIAARYNVNGSLDSSFGAAGLSTIRFEDKYSGAFSGALQQDGRLVIGGYAAGNFVVLRLLANGRIDSSFGDNGSTFTDFTSQGLDQPYGVSIQSGDGSIVLAGSYIADNLDTLAVVLAGYNKDGRRQILIAKIRRWLQNHNGIVWDNMPGVKNYAVQRSADGVRWTTVHRQQATVNRQSSIVNSPLSTVNYYNDATPLPGTNYYRLQTTSVSGVLVNSNVIVVTSDALNVSLLPNPAKNTLSIAGLPANEKVKLTVIDFSGNAKLQALANASSYNLNIASLHAGNYVIKMDMNGEVVSKQFVKE